MLVSSSSGLHHTCDEGAPRRGMVNVKTLTETFQTRSRKWKKRQDKAAFQIKPTCQTGLGRVLPWRAELSSEQSGLSCRVAWLLPPSALCQHFCATHFGISHDRFFFSDIIIILSFIWRGGYSVVEREKMGTWLDDVHSSPSLPAIVVDMGDPDTGDRLMRNDTLLRTID